VAHPHLKANFPILLLRFFQLDSQTSQATAQQIASAKYKKKNKINMCYNCRLIND